MRVARPRVHDCGSNPSIFATGLSGQLIFRPALLAAAGVRVSLVGRRRSACRRHNSCHAATRGLEINYTGRCRGVVPCAALCGKVARARAPERSTGAARFQGGRASLSGCAEVACLFFCCFLCFMFFFIGTRPCPARRSRLGRTRRSRGGRTGPCPPRACGCCAEAPPCRRPCSRS